MPIALAVNSPFLHAPLPTEAQRHLRHHHFGVDAPVVWFASSGIFLHRLGLGGIPRRENHDGRLGDGSLVLQCPIALDLRITIPLPALQGTSDGERRVPEAPARQDHPQEPPARHCLFRAPPPQVCVSFLQRDHPRFHQARRHHQWQPDTHKKTAIGTATARGYQQIVEFVSRSNMSLRNTPGTPLP